MPEAVDQPEVIGIAVPAVVTRSVLVPVSFTTAGAAKPLAVKGTQAKVV
jgi:hypothetical protein